MKDFFTDAQYVQSVPDGYRRASESTTANRDSSPNGGGVHSGRLRSVSLRVRPSLRRVNGSPREPATLSPLEGAFVSSGQRAPLRRLSPRPGFVRCGTGSPHKADTRGGK